MRGFHQEDELEINTSDIYSSHILVHAPGMIFVFWWEWGLNSGLCACKAGTLLLEPHLQSTLLWLFLTNSLLGLASNHNPPDFSLPSSQDYRLEPPAPSNFGIIFNFIRFNRSYDLV
jgi:hypothetical protein